MIRARTLQREPVTFIAYATAAYFTLVLNVIGPALPHLRAELGLRYAEAALHTSAFAVGMMLCGLFGERIVGLVGRRAAVWIGAAGMAAGLTLLALAPVAALSIAGCAVMGLVGTLQLVVMPAVISERHGESRASPSRSRTCSPISARSSRRWRSLPRSQPAPGASRALWAGSARPP